jgi:hypothetical protein
MKWVMYASALSLLLLVGCSSSIGPGSEGMAYWEPISNGMNPNQIVASVGLSSESGEFFVPVGTRLRIISPEQKKRRFFAVVLDGDLKGKTAVIERYNFMPLKP